MASLSDTLRVNRHKSVDTKTLSRFTPHVKRKDWASVVLIKRKGPSGLSVGTIVLALVILALLLMRER